MTTTLMGGKTVLVTGASSGLGRHFAQVLAGAGAKVAVAARRVEKLESLAAEIADAGGSAVAVGMDVTDRSSVTAALDEVTSELGVPEVLINNAGIATGAGALDVTDADWHKVLDTNLEGTWIVAQETAKRMKDAGGGNIVNTASILGIRVSAGVAPYAISKAGVIQMTKVLALELARHQIRVNALAPGMIASPMNQAVKENPDFGDNWNNDNLVRRWGKPEDLAGIAAFLASDEASFITGETINVDGGSIAALVRRGE